VNCNLITLFTRYKVHIKILIFVTFILEHDKNTCGTYIQCKKGEKKRQKESSMDALSTHIFTPYFLCYSKNA
jgi:hypothetical protein